MSRWAVIRPAARIALAFVERREDLFNPAFDFKFPSERRHAGGAQSV